MAKKNGKTVTFDAMVKFFVQKYNISTKKDIEKVLARMDRLENLIKKIDKNLPMGRRTSRSGRKVSGEKTATDQVMDVVGKSPKGADFNYIQEKTGFPDKKLRNIIFRLHKLGRIKRKSRGTYIS